MIVFCYIFTIKQISPEMKKLFILLAIVSVSIYSCTKENQAEQRTVKGTLSKTKKDTVPPTAFKVVKDTVPPTAALKVVKDTVPPTLQLRKDTVPPVK